jgi:threonine synthase
MRYISTRGGAPAVSFTDALLAGLAPDGGLYVPEVWPTLTRDEIASFAFRHHAFAAETILKRFAGDTLTEREAGDAACKAYGPWAQRKVITPLVQLEPGLWMLELFHGPTLAFKDVAMQLLRPLYDLALEQQGRKLTIVCATSGDTGGAAVEAFRGSEHIDLVVLFPHGRISEVQRRFMTAAPEANVRCVSVDGTFDDCQAVVKAMFADTDFTREVDLSGVNSINWARIVAQSVYYFTAAAALGAPDRKVSFAVPTGNFGDAFAGYVAHKMGLPIERIVVATNANDILTRAITTGRYAKEGGVVATQSPAMDIQVASNFERLYFEVVGRDATETRRAFETFAATGALDLPSHARSEIAALFDACATDEDKTAHQMVYTAFQTKRLLDPHTAVGVWAGVEVYRGEAPLVVLSTAHPAKFPDAVEAATGVRPALPARVGDLYARPERITHLPADLDTLKAFVRAGR